MSANSSYTSCSSTLRLYAVSNYFIIEALRSLFPSGKRVYQLPAASSSKAKHSTNLFKSLRCIECLPRSALLSTIRFGFLGLR